MKFILLVVFASGISFPTYEKRDNPVMVPGVAMQEFDTEVACKSAMDEIAKLTPQTGYEWRKTMNMKCVPKGASAK